MSDTQSAGAGENTAQPGQHEQSQPEMVSMPKAAFNERLQRARESAREEALAEINSQRQQAEQEQAKQGNQYKSLFEQEQKARQADQAKLREWEQRFQSREIDYALSSAVSKVKVADHFKGDDLMAMVRAGEVQGQYKIGIWEGKPTIMVGGENPVPRFNQAGHPITLDEFVTEFVSQRPWLQAPQVKPGSATPPVGQFSQTGASQAQPLTANPFGRKQQ